MVLGAEWNAHDAYWEAWMEDEQDLDEAILGAPGVHNYAEDLGLVSKPSAVRKHRNLLGRLKWR